MNPGTCSHCGAEVPARARACPECGADERTGWSESATLDRLGVSDPESFDYQAFEREEFGNRRLVRRHGWLWVIVAALALGAVLWRRWF